MPLTTDSNFGNDRLYFGPWDMHLTPTWLPGGEELLLVSNHEVPLGSGNAVRVPAVGCVPSSVEKFWRSLC